MGRSVLQTVPVVNSSQVMNVSNAVPLISTIFALTTVSSTLLKLLLVDKSSAARHVNYPTHPASAQTSAQLQKL